MEAGVRFVQVFPPVKPSKQPWDSHRNIKDEIEIIAGKTELPVAGLINDLEARGLLDEVIVMWCGEFGRLPISQNGRGRDHNRHSFSLWLAGGGFKPGFVYGVTDDVGYKVSENPVSIPDLQATILHQLGIDHNQLTYLHHGRPETPTEALVTKATVVRDVLDNPVVV